MRSLAALLAAFALASSAARAAVPAYTLTRSVPIGTPDRWDYLTFDPTGGRVFVAHGTETTIVGARDGRILGRLAPLDGAHGQVILPSIGRAYADGGKSGTVTAFDLASRKPIATLPARPDADAMAHDPATGRVFVIDGDSGTVTALDPTAGKIIATIDLGAGSLEFAAPDGEGHLFVNLAQARAVARIDTRSLRVTARWPIPDCTSPHGMAYDAPTRQIFTSCVDGRLEVLDAADGHVVARLPIGRGSDAVAIDPNRRRVFSSNGDGTLSVIPIGAAGQFGPTVDVPTEPGARTLAIDPASGRVFTVTADVIGARPPHVPGGAPSYRFKPGTVRMLFLDPR